MSLYAERRCAAAITLPDPWMLAQCALYEERRALDAEPADS